MGRTLHSGRALPGSAGKWDINIYIHLEALKHSTWLLCVAKAKVLEGDQKSAVSVLWGRLFGCKMSFLEVLMFLLLLCHLCLIHSVHLLHSGESQVRTRAEGGSPISEISTWFACMSECCLVPPGSSVLNCNNYFVVNRCLGCCKQFQITNQERPW